MAKADSAVVAVPRELQPIGERKDVRAELEAMRAQVEALLPARVDADRFLRVAAQAVMGNPRLMECTKVSILVAVHEAAQLGLEPSGLLGSAYLVPYRRSVEVPHPSNPNATVRTSIMEAKLIPGYRGLIDLARRSGEILAIWANVVRERDTFVVRQGTSPDIIHEPYVPDMGLPPEERDPGRFLGAYMVAVLRSGVRQAEWMTYDQIEAVRKRSRAATDGPWVTDWPEMARKTVVRRGSKYLPMTTDFRRALELDEEAERLSEVPVPPPAVQADVLRRRILAGSRGAIEAGGSDDAPDAPAEAPGPSGAVEAEGECGEMSDGSLGDPVPCTLGRGHPGPVHRFSDGQGMEQTWPMGT